MHGVKLFIKVFSGLFFFVTMFYTNYKYINKSISGSLYLSIFYIFYISKIIDCIFNIFMCMTAYKYTSGDKTQKITFNLRNTIYIDSIMLFIAAFMISLYIYYNFFINVYVAYYINFGLFLIPSVTIIQSK